MDIESNSSSSSSELSEEIIEDNSGNESNIENWIESYNDEKIFWNKAQEKNLTYQPKICPKCNF